MVASSDGQYGYDKPWQLLSETVAAERVWTNNGPSWVPPMPETPPGEMSDAWIRANAVPPRMGWGKPEQLTIYDVLDNVFSRLQKSPQTATESDDWSGVQGGYTGTMRPTGVGGGGVT
jgi:hypothetical protein